MRVKESSDEFNPAVVVPGVSIPSAPRGRSPSDYLALSIATCGVGFVPLMPGTLGSLVGVGLYLLFRSASSYMHSVGLSTRVGLPASQEFHITVMFVALFVLTFVGVWAASKAESLVGKKDPGIVVIDEVVGQMMTFLLVPVAAGFWTLVAGFLLFRFFDIVKPYPIRKLEGLKSGVGIMADDVIAGAYAAILLATVSFAVLFF